SATTLQCEEPSSLVVKSGQDAARIPQVGDLERIARVAVKVLVGPRRVGSTHTTAQPIEGIWDRLNSHRCPENLASGAVLERIVATSHQESISVKLVVHASQRGEPVLYVVRCVLCRATAHFETGAVAIGIIGVALEHHAVAADLRE